MHLRPFEFRFVQQVNFVKELIGTLMPFELRLNSLFCQKWLAIATLL
jgi:hypothetical protein